MPCGLVEFWIVCRTPGHCLVSPSPEAQTQTSRSILPLVSPLQVIVMDGDEGTSLRKQQSALPTVIAQWAVSAESVFRVARKVSPWTQTGPRRIARAVPLGPWLDQAQPTRVSWPVSSKERGCGLPRLKLVYDRFIPLRRLWGSIGLRTMPPRFRIT